MSAFLTLGCHTAQPPVTPTVEIASTATPSRPTIAPAPFKLFHQTKDSFTLVTDEHATDNQISALIYQLHDAAQTSSFDKIGLPQKFIDKRDPIVWFHIYRGAKCASEKYAAKLPCDASYHAAGDYTLGGFTNKNHDDGVIRTSTGADADHETHLWPSN